VVAWPPSVVVVSDGLLLEPVLLLESSLEPTLEVVVLSSSLPVTLVVLLLAVVLVPSVACWATRAKPAVAATADTARPVVTAVARRRPVSRLVMVGSWWVKGRCSGLAGSVLFSMHRLSPRRLCGCCAPRTGFL
jgi:hypothetical protein